MVIGEWAPDNDFLGSSLRYEGGEKMVDGQQRRYYSGGSNIFGGINYGKGENASSWARATSVLPE
jgi:hypothetical protein